MLHPTLSSGSGQDEYALTHASGLTDAANKLTGLVGATLGTIVQSVATLVAGYIIALIYHPRMAGVCIACTPLLLSAGASRLLVVVLKDAAIKRTHLRAAIDCGLLFALAGPEGDVIRLVHSMHLQPIVLAAYKRALSSRESSAHVTQWGGMSPAAVVYHIVAWGNGIYALSQSLAFLVLSLGFWYGSRQLEEGKITIERFFTVLTAVIFGSIQAGNVFNFAPDIEVARRAGAQLFRLLDRSNRIEVSLAGQPSRLSTQGLIDEEKRPAESVPTPSSELASEPSSEMGGMKRETCLDGTRFIGPAHIAFRNVSFHHPAAPFAPALLRHLTLDIPPGSYVAIITAAAGEVHLIMLKQV